MLAALRRMSAETALDLSLLPGLVAAELAVEFCALWLSAPGGGLALCARAGPGDGVAGATRLALGEGVAGRAAASGATVEQHDDAEPGGGAPAGSALAMPLRRAGRILGVICVRASRPRRFSADEVEQLSMVSMLLAEVLARRTRVPAPGADPATPRPAAVAGRRIAGTALARGVVFGRVLVSGDRKPGRLLSDDPAAEAVRLDAAMERLSATVGPLFDGGGTAAREAGAPEALEVVETARLLWAGSGWLRRVREALAGGLSAEAAVHRVAGEVRARMRGLDDPALRERLADLEDIASGLLHMLEDEHAGAYAPLPPGMILVTRRMGPAKLLHWHARGIAGLVIEEASPAGHAAILARSMGIPSLGGVRGALEAVEDGIAAILDADEERLVLRPDPAVVRHYEAVLVRSRARAATGAALRDAPNATRDGVGFTLLLNAGLPQELARLDETGAGGVGLFRTEISVLARGEMPGEAEQERFYRRVIEAAGDRPVTFRTHDLGGDKLLPGAEAGEEQNPAMGWRSLRVALDHPELLASQLRPLLRAAAGRTLRVMFPMIARVDEFDAARAILDGEARRIGGAGSVSVGAMLEVPALLFALDPLFARADFVSIGSNDLMQFLFAADRGSPRLASRYDLFAEPVLAMLETVVDAAARHGKALTVCGEMASRPLEAMVLAALGIERLSIWPDGVLRVKESLAATDLGRFRAGLARVRAAAPLAGGSLRAHIASLAAEQEIPS